MIFGTFAAADLIGAGRSNWLASQDNLVKLVCLLAEGAFAKPTGQHDLIRLAHQSTC